jgi:hypothetical protein
MPKLKPDRIMFLQKNILFFRWTTSFAEHLKNAIP